jgi:hypothetical protein
MVPKQSVDESKDDDFLKKIGIKGVVGWLVYFLFSFAATRKEEKEFSFSLFLSTFKFQDVHLW